VTIALNLALVIGSIVGMLALLAAVKRLGDANGLSKELQRKCVHVGTGLFALSLPLIFAARWPVLVLIGLSLVVLLTLRLRRFAGDGISSAVHGVARTSYGELFLAISVGFLFVRSAEAPVLYVLPILVLTLSDAAAALTGTRYGSRHFAVEAGTKSWEGVTMFFLVTWILALILLLLMTDLGRVEIVLLSVTIAAFGALVEADSWRGFDNLFVPVGLHLLLANSMTTGLVALFIMVAALLAGLVLMLLFAPMIGLTRHAARAYAVLIFLVCSATAPHNAVLPVLAIFAHLIARNVRPCTSQYPDLDLIAAVTAAALFWLFIGDWTGQNAINTYNLGFAGAALGFLALLPGRMALIAASGVAAVVLVLVFVVGANPAHTHWFGALWPWALATLAQCFLVVRLVPTAFDRQRALRVVALSLVVPVGLYLSHLALRTPTT
jgi:phytol kinase